MHHFNCIGHDFVLVPTLPAKIMKIVCTIVLRDDRKFQKTQVSIQTVRVTDFTDIIVFQL